MVKPVTGLSIPMPILRLNFITKLIYIHLSKPMILLAKLITRTTSSITMYTYFCIPPLLRYYAMLILPLIFQNLIIFTPTTSGICCVAITLTVRLFLESLSRL